MKKSKYLTLAIEAAMGASAVLLSYFDKNLEIELKKENEVVTIADRKSEEVIVKMINKFFPDHSIWSEERPEEKKDSDYRWIIDPLDGSRVYTQGLPFWGISIALEYKNKIIMGLNYFPMLDKMYYAEKGKGAYLNGNCISVSDKKNSDMLFFFGSTEMFRYPKNLKPFLSKLQSRELHFKSIGSTALEMSFVAEGRADAGFELHVKPCDVAAGSLLVTEAGGKVIQTDGKKVTFDSTRVIAYNGKIRKTVLNI